MLVTVPYMMERYGCSRPTAVKYIRQMKPHMEKPWTATPEALKEWEDSRTIYPDGTSKKEKERITKRQGQIRVPRKREG